LVSIDSIEPRHLELHFSPLLVDGRTKPGSLLVVHDVTKIQKLERIRRDFVANVSHELRTPITSIKGFVETLLDGAKEEKPLLDKFLGTIDRQAERLNSIFEDLLTLSRLEAGVGDTPLDKELKAIEEIVDAAMEECLPLAEAKRINISVSKDLSGIVEVNARFLEQALVNLIENAIKYSREDAVIRVGRVAHVSHVGIAVVDKGLGIPEKHLPRLFERFYRVDPGRSRQMGGTGLGLAIVKHIAQLHGGWISVESREGLGSTFTLFVPRADEPR
jgi:two-component system phosphate regulon sensor histidine kinase PhoR